MDFVHDQLATGRKIRVLTIVDTFSRFSPAVDPRFSYRGEDVVMGLARICKNVGYPKTIRVDQGSEFVSRDLDIWAYQKRVVLDFSGPGKPGWLTHRGSSMTIPGSPVDFIVVRGLLADVSRDRTIAATWGFRFDMLAVRSAAGGARQPCRKAGQSGYKEK